MSRRPIPALCRVLLVEDDVQVASLTSAMLAELGYEVIPVTTGSSRLERACRNPRHRTGAIGCHDAGRHGRHGVGARDAPTQNLIARGFGQRIFRGRKTRRRERRHSAAAEALHLGRSGFSTDFRTGEAWRAPAEPADLGPVRGFRGPRPSRCAFGLILDGQAANSLAGCGKNRIAQGRCNRRHARLTDAAQWHGPIGRRNQVHTDVGRAPHSSA